MYKEPSTYELKQELNPECNANETIRNTSVHELVCTASPKIIENPEKRVAGLTCNDIGNSPEAAPEDEAICDPERKTPDMETEISRLLENSKCLLKTVSKTLEESKSPKKIDHCFDRRSLDNTDLNLQTKDALNQTLVARSKASATTSEEKNRCKDLASSHTDEADEQEIEGCSTPKRMVPEGCIRVWVGEMVLALEALHDAGITYG